MVTAKDLKDHQSLLQQIKTQNKIQTSAPIFNRCAGLHKNQKK